ncbi:chemoreceptor glutamine deamidase CheD [Pleionea mediterranea]|uniref:Probable chemoreceptor glutamine deamidase CheD n=1 Tax=Pleionea mediterranea TaxID=523701 RepID=A0A316FJR1_9GAMM|nr:chemoreceptor glutamine deamidase CheD [Pleionea mediterranea]PWK49148.1 chemotaxis protein CheD [Pleionea mediterranea]
MIKFLKPKIPEALPGFDTVARYYDRHNQKVAAKIKPGEYYVSNTDELIVTVLGSCISACIRDRVNHIGGMNHFMLPVTDEEKFTGANAHKGAARYGNFAMEFLINNILRNGGERQHLEVKLFGGAKVIKKMSDVGDRNIQFIHEYMSSENLQVLASDLGGNHPRKVLYNPLTGVVRVKKLRNLHNDTIVRREDRYLNDIQSDQTVKSDIELFD